MSVELDPPELGFRRPFTHEVTQILRLRNPNNEAVAFKWQYVEKTAKASIQERKIRVSFLPSDGFNGTPQRSGVNGTHPSDEAPPAYGSPAPSFGSPAPDSTTAQTRSAIEPVGAVSYPDSRPADNRHLGDAKESANNPATSNQSGIGATASSAVNAVMPSTANLQRELAEARAEIKNLRQNAEEQGLRQRKSDSVNQDSRERITTGTTGMGVQQQPADGVPVQIVAALCLLSFLLAYFFF
ncbi:phosphatidylinositol-binding protein scs2 [Loxospora ochrophaea]|nr:phosphatidylinositol-binding protein scs2 [Loxospora ochrophaea]